MVPHPHPSCLPVCKRREFKPPLPHFAAFSCILRSNFPSLELTSCIRIRQRENFFSVFNQSSLERRGWVELSSSAHPIAAHHRKAHCTLRHACQGVSPIDYSGSTFKVNKLRFAVKRCKIVGVQPHGTQGFFLTPSSPTLLASLGGIL